MDDDFSLLASFARHRDEQAFRILAKRHFSLIFHTALRRTGDRPLAEDVSQNVLCLLAKKAASLAATKGCLPAWLHRSTLLLSSEAMRKEASHRRRSQLVEPPSIEEAESPWTAALPHLDLALDKLSAVDRRVLLLHYFEGMPFPKVAETLGKSTAAVQKQSIRALDKLGRLLRAQGLVFRSGALIAGLAGESARSAPLSLLPSFTAKAIASQTALSTSSSLLLTLATHQKLVAASAVLLLGLPLAIQQMAITAAEQRLEKLGATLPPPAPGSAATKTVRNSGKTGGIHISDSLDLARLADEAWLAERAESLQPPLWKKLQALDSGKLADLLRSDLPSSGRSRSLATLLSDILGPRDPRAALNALLDAGWKGDVQPTNQFARWLAADPEAAGKWLMEAQQRADIAAELNQKFEGPTSSSESDFLIYGPSISISPMQGALVAHLIENGRFEEFRHYLNSLPPNTWQLDMIVEALGSFRSNGATPEATRNYVRIIREYLPGPLFVPGLTTLVRHISGKRISPSLDALIQDPGLTPDERHAAGVAIAKHLLNGDVYYARKRDAPLETAEHWLGRMMPAEAASILDEVLPEVAAQIEGMEAMQLRMLAERGPNPPDDVIDKALLRKRFIYHLPEALKAAESIKSPTLRERVLNRLNHPSE